jgi:Uma2 family endonuclease
MVVAAPEPKIAASLAIGEQRVVFRGIDWAGYLQILAALPESRNSRLTYDDGVLEVTVPLEEHEFSAENIAYFLLTLVGLLGLRLKSMGSTTMNYPGLKKGAEPDKAYYIQNYGRVQGRIVDFAKDPPPDLVVEVDITHTDIAKNQFYARLGVPEFWRFDGKVLRIYQLQAAQYLEVEQSPTFSMMPKQWLYDFLRVSQAEGETVAVQALQSTFAAHQSNPS